MSVVIHIPHAGYLIPDDLRDQFLLDDDQLRAEKMRMTDGLTSILFDGIPDAERVVFPVSRLVVDPERFADDAQEPMAMVGMGVVYMRTSCGGELRRPLSVEEREVLLQRFYRPHHALFASRVQAALDKHDQCLIIDAHSFPERPLLYEANHQAQRPEICLGTDGYHTPPELLHWAREFFEEEGFEVAVNTPFSGAIVPAAFYQQDERVHSLMIEVRRDLYLREDHPLPNGRFLDTRTRLIAALTRLVELYQTRQ